jgi:hypothetical protein
MDLQKRSHPIDKVPVILPFLADAILALGGTTSEGIFRIPGDSVSELKSRIDRGNYELVSVPAWHPYACRRCHQTQIGYATAATPHDTTQTSLL